MMKYILLILALNFTTILPQQKYFIYFSDKGSENSNYLNKTSSAYKLALQSLSERSIERRMKSMGNDFITYDDLPIFHSYLDSLNSLGIEVLRKLNWFNSVSAVLTSEQILKLKQFRFVDSVVAVKTLYRKDDSSEQIIFNKANISDTSYNYGNSFKQMSLSDVPIVHSKNINGKNVLIGILDTGFDWERHVALNQRNVLAEYDFIFNDTITANQTGDASGQDSHGTYVFSVLAGFKDSVLIGPAFNASFLLAKTEDVRSETKVEEDNYAAALIWMDALGVDITTSSLGYNTFDTGTSYSYKDMDGRTTIVTKALEMAFQRGISTFTSAGNEGNSSWKYITAPADGFNVIAVGAVDEFGSLAGFSSRGPTYDGRFKPEVVAQGVSVYGATAGTTNSYRMANGTSAAAPIASGVAALLLSAHQHLNNKQIRSIILESSSNSANPNNQIGYGVISAKNAIEFPNLQYKDNKLLLHKVIFDQNKLDESVKLNIVVDGVSEQLSFVKNSDCFYSVEVPQKYNGLTVNFNIMYADSQNIGHINPQTGFYSFVFGSDIISHNLSVKHPETEYNVSEFFPHPFIPAKHKTTGFYFNSVGDELFSLVIIDASGQKVNEFSTKTLQGKNYFEWNGISDKNFLCASGVYYVLFNIGSQQYGKKIVLLK